MSKYITTPVVDAISAASIYVDPAVWSKRITHKSGKPHWLAIIWFSKLLYWYERSKVFNEVTGTFLGYKKKFKYDKLQRSYADIAKELGCTVSEAQSIVAALLRAKLITQELRDYPDLKLNNLMFIEPIPENILCIMHPKGVHKDTPPPSEKGRVSPAKNGEAPPSRTGTCTLSSTLTSPTLTSTYDSKGDTSVDNSEQLPTSCPPTGNKIFKKEEGGREQSAENISDIKRLLKQAVGSMKLNGRQHTTRGRA